ncbi:PRE C2HC domain-containing protein [Aphis craccivora]|uniref:PRE C2HC domain-containing protein n=1 Tax=Aphis craccivora TaxID=307492 RepID=A0A6G0Y467_APHCR|nr:PRE C2HC domain-containing protein [Aphis craccivora]
MSPMLNTTKTKLRCPCYYTDIFSITSILHTKNHKKRQIPQYQNCQSYGRTRSYCAYPLICVKCGENHLSSSCTKSQDLPTKCGLCQGAHPANYKGCTIYQTISRKHNNNTSSKKAQQPPPHNLNINTNPEYQQQQLGSENTPRSRTYANVTEGHQSANSNTSTNTNETSLLKFLDEFKSIMNPLISLLATVDKSCKSCNDANICFVFVDAIRNIKQFKDTPSLIIEKPFKEYLAGAKFRDLKKKKQNQDNLMKTVYYSYPIPATKADTACKCIHKLLNCYYSVTTCIKKITAVL